MAIKKLLTVGGILGTGATVIYTAPTSMDVIITTARAVNVGAAAATYSFTIGTKDMAKNVPLQPAGIDIHIEAQPMFLNAGQTITGSASVAATVALTASVIERDAI